MRQYEKSLVAVRCILVGERGLMVEPEGGRGSGGELCWRATRQKLPGWNSSHRRGGERSWLLSALFETFGTIGGPFRFGGFHQVLRQRPLIGKTTTEILHVVQNDGPRSCDSLGSVTRAELGCAEGS